MHCSGQSHSHAVGSLIPMPHGLKPELGIGMGTTHTNLDCRCYPLSSPCHQSSGAAREEMLSSAVSDYTKELNRCEKEIKHYSPPVSHPSVL